MQDFLERIGKLPPKKLALLAAQLRGRLDALERERTEPIAIVGMACRFPGGADAPEAYWRLLRDGEDAIREVPAARWDVDALYDPDPDAPGKMSTRWGGFLDRIDRFDAAFFGISPREAAGMDPQQRLLLEVRLGGARARRRCRPSALAGSRTGVFVGICSIDYCDCSARLATWRASTPTPAPATPSASRPAGSRTCSACRARAWRVDTACSSSLVAVHLAVPEPARRRVRRWRWPAASTLIARRSTIDRAARRRACWPPDGRCKTFDAAADGFVRGEGCGVRRAEAAVRRAGRRRPRSWRVIRGSAINQDGRSSGLTAPNGPAQEAVIREALRQRPASSRREVGYVEAHGTGTPLGDPIEVQALAAVLGEGAAGRSAAAGRLGQDQHRPPRSGGRHRRPDQGGARRCSTAQIPPHLHFEHAQPAHSRWSDAAGRDADRRRRRGRAAGAAASPASARSASAAPTPTWSRGGAAGRAGRETATVERPAHLLALSARSETALGALAGAARRAPAPSPGLALADVVLHARTPAARTSRTAWRVVVRRRPTRRWRDAERCGGGSASARASARGVPASAAAEGRVPVHRPGLAVRRAWAASSTRRSRCSARRSTAARRCSRRCSTVPLLDVLYPEAASDAGAAATRRRTRSRRCSRSSTRWPSCGARGASSRPWCSATASASTSPPASPACSRLEDGLRAGRASAAG